MAHADGAGVNLTEEGRKVHNARERDKYLLMAALCQRDARTAHGYVVSYRDHAGADERSLTCAVLWQAEERARRSMVRRYLDAAERAQS